MQLAAYIEAKKTTLDALAKAVGVSQSYMSRLASGEKKPSFEVASRIAAATGGQVMPNDFMEDLPELIEGFDSPDALGDAADDETPPARKAG